MSDTSDTSTTVSQIQPDGKRADVTVDTSGHPAAGARLETVDENTQIGVDGKRAPASTSGSALTPEPEAVEPEVEAEPVVEQEPAPEVEPAPAPAPEPAPAPAPAPEHEHKAEHHKAHAEHKPKAEHKAEHKAHEAKHEGDAGQ